MPPLTPTLSIIIPAFNEERELPACLVSIEQAVAEVQRDPGRADVSTEVIVCDNNSTDATAAIARAAGAKVTFEPINQISRARNRGAKLASADWMLFVDADSRLHPTTLNEVLTAMRRGHCAGGGCIVSLEPAPWWGKCLVQLWNFISRYMRWPAGSFLFCRSDAYWELGGFSERFYAAEEIEFSQRMKRWATSHGKKCLILTGHPHVSSGRKLMIYGKWDIILLALRAICCPGRTLGSAHGLGYFYERR